MMFAFNELGTMRAHGKHAASAPLSLENDAHGSDLFNDLFLCE
jgi:hypothetical protein